MQPLDFLIFWLLPLVACLIAHRITKPHAGLFIGVLFGAVVSPASLGLYSVYYLGPNAFIGSASLFVGLTGLLLVLFHSAPGFHIARAWHLLDSQNVIDGFRDSLIIEGLNGVVWAIAYGVLGAIFDWYRRKSTSVD